MEKRNVSRACNRQKYVDPEKILLAVEKIDAAIQITSDVTVVLDNIIHEVIQIFESDRAWLFYPCNPHLPSFEVAFESTTPSYPGAKALKENVPMTKGMADYCRRALSKVGEPEIDPPSGYPMTNDIAIRFDVKSMLFMALQPQIGDAWMFGLHQCDHRRVWSDDDKHLFKTIGHRITNCIGNMLYFKELKENEEKYRSLFENAQDAIFVADPETSTLIDANRSAEMLTGYGRDELIGKHQTFIHPLDESNFYAQEFQKSAETKGAKFKEMLVRTKNGRNVPVEISSGGTIEVNSRKHHFGIFRDITERKAAEERLLKANKLLRSVIHQAPYAIHILEGDINSINVILENEESARIMGERVEGRKGINAELPEMLSTRFFSVDGKHEIPLNKMPSPRAFKGETVMNEEFLFLHANGDRLLVEASASPIYDSNKKIVAVVVIFQDITEKKQIQLALERVRYSIDKVADTILWVDRNGKFIDANDAACQNLEYSREELLTMGVKDIDPYFPQEMWPAHWEKIEKRGTLVIESVHETKSGRQYPVEIAIHNQQFGDDRYHCVLVRNIADRKRIEEELRQAHKMEAIGNLAGGIAHEFNNVLGIILGNAELALDDVPDWNPAKESLKEIRTASFRAKEVVRQILSFARKTMTSLKPMDINTIVKESLKLMRASIPAMIDVQASIPSGPEMILGDPTEIHQIVINLCTNAAHAMRESAGVLEVEVSEVNLDDRSATFYEELSPGDFVKLTVRDSGEGMSPEIIEKVFEPYFTTKEFGAGSGMGLAVVYGIVKKCKGAIHIKSVMGEGTTVEVLFPKAEEKAPVTEEKEKDWN